MQKLITAEDTLYFIINNYPKAIADLDKAISINPKLTKVYENRALYYLKMGDKLKAKQNLQSAAQIYQSQGKIAEYQAVMQALENL